MKSRARHLLALAAGLTVACSSFESVAPPGSSGRADGGLPPGCDPSREPKDAPACVADGVGVFVDGAGGNDANAGTKASPFKTIGAALARRGDAKRVYVCEGTYAEHVKVDAAVSLFGGFSCAGWGYTGAKAKVAPSDEGYALEVSGVSKAVTFADLEIVAKDAITAGASSIAAWVKSSAAVTFQRCVLQAGKGANGADGAKGATGALESSTPTAGTLDGNAGSGSFGGLAQVCTCVGGTSTGDGTSKGGGGGNLNGDGNDGELAKTTPDPPTATGAGQTSTQCQNGTASPRPGSNGEAAPGATGANAVGTLTTAWNPAGGATGSTGGSGQGGGGGGGNGGGGGGGACGGCGGAGGIGGSGGGASAAILLLDSALKVSLSQLITSDAGGGGAGGPGGDGQTGGIKGARAGTACDGANGGRGGNGGAGGGGAGGISVGVLYKGPAPTLESTTITLGTPGAKGIGGAPGVNDGIPGVAADTLAAP